MFTRRTSIHPLHLDPEQRTALVPLDRELDRAAADLAVLDVSRVIRGQIDAGLEPFTAVRTLDRDELFGRKSSTRRGGGLIDRLEAVELIDAVRIHACDPLRQGLQRFVLGIAHPRILRDPPPRPLPEL